ncbi:hypothetical protein BDY17DRAFT_305430 [Neohortaea acidophila]|uniref:Conserved oligomeric Golgi complex subunit 1 n=1 Tax=Neohortaea acidophila TaxID=245834 RepID=A0A6A6PG12_9PEZI|nr:uncharacterized protein BDY17DRAFT_305430 [Neohortaea acidophila]KAF2478573.1 hypothetical protein BDY17DRAFT_305430 [Neohortaea acidophila]
MARVSLDKARLPRVLCGYVLVTSSTPRQVLRHFLQMRLDELNRATETPSESHVVQMLELYTQTLADTRDLFPRRFADLLARVSKGPLVQDEQVTSLFELNLDIYSSWMPEDFQTFTPWFRHDHLVSTEVTDALAAWTQQARSCVFEGVAEYLSGEDDAQTILDARQKFISNFMEMSNTTKDVDSTEVVQGVRLAFLERLSELAAQAATVDDLAIGDADEPALPTSESLSSLWDVATEDYDLAHGAFGLRRALLDARHGRDKKLRVEIEKLDAWMKRLNDFLDVADEMSSTTWEDNSDFHLDDTNGDDSLQQILSKQDPEQLRSRLRTVIQDSLTRIRTQLDAVAPSTNHPAFYIRIWREIDWRCQALDNRLSIPSDSFSVAELHRNLAQSLSKAVVPAAIELSKKRRHVPTTLWDGSPPLPIQCSPMIIKFLTKLHRAMEEGGTDVWNLHCVAEAKKAIADALEQGLDDPEFTLCSSTDVVKGEVLTNGHSEDNEANGHVEEERSPAQDEKSDRLEARQRARIVQNLFDTLYLGQVLADGEAFHSLVEKLTKNGEVDEGSLERLRKSASEYWRRTYLLFGALAA